MGERVEEQGPEESKTDIWTEAHMETMGAWSQLAPAHESQLYVCLPNFIFSEVL